MIDFQNKKVSIPFGVGALLVVFYLISGLFGKTDDWQYSYVSEQQWLIYGGVALGLILLSWLIVSIYLIVRGRPDESGVNVKRKLGIWLLVAPIVLIVAGFALLITGFEIAILAIPVVALILMIVGIVYAIKRHAKIALIPLILFPLVVIGIGGFGLFGLMGSTTQFASTSALSASGNLGFSVGGSKDVDNFRKNIEHDYLPAPTDITYEGLYYDYFFDTGETEVCEKLFCPSYSYALSKDPLSQEEEYYLQVGLNSGIKEEDFERKKLNVVVVLDISGSMGSSFNKYYYDQFGNRELREQEEDEDATKSKMEIASKAVVGLLGHLNEDDRFGMVLFDNSDYLGKPLSLVGETDMNAIEGHILELAPRGGTNFKAGYRGGTELFEKYLDADSDEYENRIIFLTDAMPNRGATSEEGLLGLTQTNADNKLYTTFIGIGVDFNTELVEAITKIRGANYYSVHSSKEFKTRMDDEFEYMVTPLVFNLLLKLESSGFEIEKVYGSPEANEATGEIMKVNTLFPSKKEDGQIRGGIIILKLKKIGDNTDIKLTTSYEDRSGTAGGDEISIEVPDVQADYYENTGIRKGIVLARYVNVMRNWIDDEKESHEQNKPINPVMTYDTGIVIPPDVEIPRELGRWERQSIPLQVSEEYQTMISDFNDYFASETQAIGDSTMNQEVEIMEKLTK